MNSSKPKLVIFQNYFTLYRHKLFIEVAKHVDLTLIYMQKPQEEGRGWNENTKEVNKHYKSIQLQNKRLFKIKPFNQIVWVTGLKQLKDLVSPDTKVIFLDNMPTNFTMLRIISTFASIVPRKNRILWNEHILPQGSDSLLKDLYKKFMTMMLALRVDTVLSFSEMNTAYLKKLGIPLTGQKVIRTFQATYTKSEIQEYRSEMDKKKASGQEILTFGFLGFFSKRKGILEFLHAITYYRNEKARFVFVGMGPLMKDIEKAALLDSRIHIKPYAITEQEKTEYFREMTVNVVASEKDPWVVVVNETACRGVPSLVSPNVGAKEIISMIDTSFVLPNNHAITLVKAFLDIEKKFSNKHGWEQIREKTFNVAEKWNIEKFAETFVNLCT